MIFEIKRGSRGPRLEATLSSSGVAQNLTGTTVKLYATRVRTGVILLNGSAVTIDTPLEGKVHFDWPDTSAWLLGMYRCEFEVTGGSPSPVRFPSNEYWYIHVLPEVK